jgi:ABC-type multidrug transport system ATPase subunit
MPAIQTWGITKTYPRRNGPALAGIDLAVEPGHICALLGENGAGKTTLVRVLSTLTRPTEGRAEVAGYDVQRRGGEVRRRIGLVGQSASVDELLTGRANLAMFGVLSGLAPPAARTRADDLLERFGLAEAAERPVGDWSGGMRRRLDLAVGLLGTPDVLFVDEPTTGLDPHARRDLWRDLRALAADGTTILLTTQYLEEADELADQVVILRAGRVALAGAAHEVRRLAGEPRMELRRPTLEDVYLRLHEEAR